MSNSDIVRAWKDPEYRLIAGGMPPHPAGLIELADAGLDGSSEKGGGFRRESAKHKHYTKDCTFSTHKDCGCT